MKVKNYTEWKQAVSAEHRKLSEVSQYLNEKGMERYLAFAALENLSAFCDTAEELLTWIDSKAGPTKCDTASAISALRRIVNANWTERLSKDVVERLEDCRTIKSDLPALVNAKWGHYKDLGKEKHGLTKEDALVAVLELLDCNSCSFDLTIDEYNDLCK